MNTADLRIAQVVKQELPKDLARQFMLIFPARKKSVGVGVACALLLGGLGIHKFYLGDSASGIIYLVCGTVGWFLILPPIIIAIACIIDACTMGKIVSHHNEQAASQLIDELKLLAE